MSPQPAVLARRLRLDLNRLAPVVFVAVFLAVPFGGSAAAVSPAAPASAPSGVSTAGASVVDQAIASLAEGAGPADGAALGTTPTLALPGGGGHGGGGGGENETATNGTWATVTQARCCGGLVYDPVIGASVLFGGSAGGEALGDTWEYSGGTWTRMFISSSLSVHAGISMAYDARDGYVLLFGGLRGGHYLAETWTFQDGAWTKLSPPISPTARTGGAMAFDAADNEVVLFGGYNGATVLSDTWSFAGGAWTLLSTPTSPSPRTNASLAYDEAEHTLVLFGGMTTGAYYNDTWTFAGGVWTPKAFAAGEPTPSARGSAAISWNGADHEILLMGGQSPSGVLGDVWVYSSGAWAPAATGPSPRYGAMASYDPSSGTVLFFGGQAGSLAYADTWTFADNTWTLVGAAAKPVARTGADLVLDGATGHALLFGGWSGVAYLGDTWTYVNGNWTLVASTGAGPGPRTQAGLAYVATGPNATDGYVLLFGGYNGAYLNDTWAFQNGAWTRLAPATSPSPRMGMVLASDGESGSALLIGGLGSAGYLDDLWAFDAQTTSWTPVSSVLDGSPAPFTPDARAFASAVYDGVAGGVFLFGGLNTAGYLGDTWVVGPPDPAGVSTWTDPVTGSATPPPRANASLAWDDEPPYSNAMMFGGTSGSSAGTSALSDFWAFGQGNWTKVPPPVPGGMGGEEAASPVPRTGAATVFSPADGYLVTFGGDNGTAMPADTWVWIVFLAQGAMSLNPADAGVAVHYHAAMFGGVVPFTYFWDFGDGSSSALAAPMHTYTVTAPTEYTVRLVVNDSAANSSVETMPLEVYPGLAVNVAASPTLVDVGVPVTFGASASGGAPPLRTSWQFGDGAVGTLAAESHAYAAPGTYRATVWTNSSGGSTSVESVTVDVVAGPTAQILASHAVTDVGLPVAFTTAVSDGVAPHSYDWSFGDGGRASVASVEHTYGAPGAYAVTLWVNDSFSLTAVATAEVLVNPWPTLSTPVASPGETDVGYPVALQTVGEGGSGPLVVTWRFGDGASATGGSLAHSYAAPGTYLAEVWANDTVGASAYANVSVSVQPRPAIASFVAQPATVSVGDPLTLAVAVTGGVAPYSIVHAGLPPGCLSADSGTLSCRPNASGTYEVTVYVTDSIGAQVSATTTVTVTAPEAPAETVLGMEPTWGYTTIALVIAVAAVDAVLITYLLLRRGKARS